MRCILHDESTPHNTLFAVPANGYAVKWHFNFTSQCSVLKCHISGYADTSNGSAVPNSNVRIFHLNCICFCAVQITMYKCWTSVAYFVCRQILFYPLILLLSTQAHIKWLHNDVVSFIASNFTFRTFSISLRSSVEFQLVLLLIMKFILSKRNVVLWFCMLSCFCLFYRHMWAESTLPHTHQHLECVLFCVDFLEFHIFIHFRSASCSFSSARRSLSLARFSRDELNKYFLNKY